MPVPAFDSDHVHRITAEVLSRAEFAPARPSLLARVRHFLFGWFSDLVQGVEFGGAAPLAGVVMLVLVVVLLVVLGVRFFAGVRRSGRVGPDVATVRRTTGAWLAESVAHEQAERWRDAVRCRYRALVASLAAAGIVEEVPGRTAGEYLAAVRRRLPEAAEAFEDATRVFESAWYGRAVVGPAEVESLATAATAVTHAASGRVAAGATP